LVQYFDVKVGFAYWGMTPGSINYGALGACIRTWDRKDGIDPIMVKAMIDDFASDQQFIRQSTPAWKSFINQRQKLFEIAAFRVKDKKNARRNGEVRIMGHMPRKAGD